MYILIPLIFGLVAGLLVDYLSDLLPTRQFFTRPFCTHCSEPRTWSEFLLMRPCAHCAKPRSWRTFLCLALGLILSILLWVYAPGKLGYWLSLVLVTYFGVVMVIDIEHRLIMHVVTLFGAGLGLILGMVAHTIGQTLVGGLSGFIVMLIFYELGVVFARFNARRQGLSEPVEEALGFGDVTLSGVLGLILGFSNIFYGLIIGIFLAGLFSLLLIVALVSTKKFRIGDIYIPYGPFLILGACVYIFFR